jgi:hypothetical protein
MIATFFSTSSNEQQSATLAKNKIPILKKEHIVAMPKKGNWQAH